VVFAEKTTTKSLNFGYTFWLETKEQKLELKILCQLSEAKLA